MSTVFISSEAASAVFQWAPAISAMQAAYAVPGTHAALPPRTVASDKDAWLRCLPALPPGNRHFGAKLMGMSRASQTPGVDYVIVLYDRETSRLAAFVDGNHVTGYRTAATSAAALDKMLPDAPVTVAVLGSGLEATMHLRALASIRTISACTVFSPTQHKREAFARDLGEELGISIVARGTAEEGVREADVVLAAARSQGEKPILYGDWLRPGATVVSIGSTVPEQREIDVSVVAAAGFIVCDTLDEVMSETGDMIAAARAGIDVSGRCFSMHQLMSGELEDRKNGTAIRMFKSVGAGLQDIVIAELILARAREAGLAIVLPMAFDTKQPHKKG